MTTTTKLQDLMAIGCANCGTVIFAPRRESETAPALRRVDWTWDGLSALCRNCNGYHDRQH